MYSGQPSPHISQVPVIPAATILIWKPTGSEPSGSICSTTLRMAPSRFTCFITLSDLISVHTVCTDASRRFDLVEGGSGRLGGGSLAGPASRGGLGRCSLLGGSLRGRLLGRGLGGVGLEERLGVLVSLHHV